jgi:aldehyde:ferredoxin oxidoreductase
MEAVRREKIDYPIRYGDADAVAGLLEKIAYRRDIGDVLADGIRAAASEWGLEDIAVHVKGLEPAGYDPRALKGMGLAYATSDRGACHLRSTFYKPELAGMIDRDQIEGKAELFIDFEDRLTLFDSLILCRFYRDLYDWEGLGRLVRYTCGLDAVKVDLQRIAARILNLVRGFNLQEGLRPQDDTLPPALHRRLEDSGGVITAAELGAMLDDYYRLRGWPRD